MCVWPRVFLYFVFELFSKKEREREEFPKENKKKEKEKEKKTHPHDSPRTAHRTSPHTSTRPSKPLLQNSIAAFHPPFPPAATKE